MKDQQYLTYMCNVIEPVRHVIKRVFLCDVIEDDYALHVKKTFLGVLNQRFEGYDFTIPLFLANY